MLPIARTTILAPIALLALPACSTMGELGEGRFDYICLGVDIACTASSIQEDRTTVPESIAVGAVFGLAYEDDGSSSELVQGKALVRLQPASVEVVRPAGGGFVIQHEGMAAILAFEDEEVRDFIRVHGRAIDGVVVTTDGPAGAPQRVSELGVVVPASFDADPLVLSGRPALGSTVLAGSFACTWKVADPTVVALSSKGACTTEIRGTAAGETEIVVSMGDFHEKIRIVVEAAP